MPFTKIKRGPQRGKYRSPSGRVFTRKQVRRYYARGGTFDAGLGMADGGLQHVADTKPVGSRDPTGTAGLRRAFRADFGRRWQQVVAAARAALVEQDQFGFKVPAVIASGDALRVQAFQTWLDALLTRVVLDGLGGWLGPYLQAAYASAQERAGKFVDRVPMPANTDALQIAARIELQGVAEAVSQQAVRAFANGVIDKMSATSVMAQINRVVRKIGVTRSRSLADFSVVRAHANGTLDTFERAGVQRVALVPESHWHAPVRVRDANVEDAPRRRRIRYREGSRTTQPAARTLRRIRQRQRELEQQFPSLVNVLTAGDDKVCQICQDIAADGPYTINEARGLIPAHPRCRCALIPADERDETVDARFYVDVFDPNQPRDPRGNTSPMETEGVDDPTSYVIFNPRDLRPRYRARDWSRVVWDWRRQWGARRSQ